MPPDAPSEHQNKTGMAGPGAKRLRSWPLVWRLPVAMASVVMLFAVVLTIFGLQELERREAELRVEVGGAFLDTLAGLITPAVTAGAPLSEIEGLLSASARFKPSLRNEAVAVCCLADGPILMTSSYPDDPTNGAKPRTTELALEDWLNANRSLPPNEAAIQNVDETNKQLIAQSFPVSDGSTILLGAAFDLEWQRSEQEERRRVALAVDVAFSVLAAILTFFIAQHSLRPIDDLTKALDDDSFDTQTEVEPASANTEIGRLQNALRTRAELQARADAIAKTENKHAREATLARLAAGLAHEVRNPLAGMSAATSTLRRFGDDKTVREQTIDLIDRGLQSIDHVAASMLSTYRPPEGNRDLKPDDLNDLRTLINPKVRAKQVDLSFQSELAETYPASAEAVRQIVLNLLLNAIDATPVGSTVAFESKLIEEQLTIKVSDSGPGLPGEALNVLTGGTTTEKPQTRRLGLWLVHQLIDDVNGRLAISTRPQSGTVITITIPKRTDEAENV
jgi:signal transduction histidine kinase